MFRGFAGSARSAGPGDRYSAELRPAVRARDTWAMFRYDASQGAAQDSVPAIVFYRQSGLVECPRDSSICWSAQLVRLEPAGHIPIYERGHAVSARIALFPDELQQSVGMEERCRIRS